MCIEIVNIWNWSYIGLDFFENLFMWNPKFALREICVYFIFDKFEWWNFLFVVVNSLF
jgi:hypothetical protein